jgi:cytochrome oxidase assembly protein ShyY1
MEQIEEQIKEHTGASWTEWMFDSAAPTVTDLVAETVEQIQQAGYSAVVTDRGWIATEMPDHVYRALMKKQGYVCTRPVTYSLSYTHILKFRTAREATVAEDQMRNDDIEGPQSEIDIPDFARQVQFTTEFAISQEAQTTIIDRYHPVSVSFNVKQSFVQ